MVEGLTVERARELFAGLLPAPGPVRAVSRFAEGSVTGAYRIEFAGADPAQVAFEQADLLKASTCGEMSTPWPVRNLSARASLTANRRLPAS